MGHDPIDLDGRKTGGAGATTQPLTDGEYREQMRKIQRLAGVSSDDAR